jgi:hypothetical protein
MLQGREFCSPIQSLIAIGANDRGIRRDVKLHNPLTRVRSRQYAVVERDHVVGWNSATRGLDEGRGQQCLVITHQAITSQWWNRVLNAT